MPYNAPLSVNRFLTVRVLRVNQLVFVAFPLCGGQLAVVDSTIRPGTDAPFCFKFEVGILFSRHCSRFGLSIVRDQQTVLHSI